jgi:iron(III) transport system substrate-binding protein
MDENTAFWGDIALCFELFLSKFKNMKLHLLAALFGGVLLLSGCFQNTQTAEEKSMEREVNLYTDRHYPIDDSIFNLFSEAYGIRVNVVKGDAQELLARIDKEGAATKADLLVTTDIARLYQAKASGLFRNVDIQDALTDVPAYLYDAEGYWFGLTKRARVIVVSKERMSANDIVNYEDLADSKWKGRIAMRPKDNVYNQSLLAGVIAANGEENALDWVKKVVENMYDKPKGNDRDQVKAIYAGNADASIVNTYYLGKMFTSDDPLEVKAAESVRIIFPNQENRGTHINISGAGVLTHAKNASEAELFIKFMLSPDIQGLYAEANFEYPVLSTVKSSDLISSWGDFKEDKLSLNRLGELNSTAIKLFDMGGWK